jgi:hypothetical protein
MPTLSLTLTDAALAKLVDAMCDVYRYSATLPNGNANPETRAQFARRMVIVQLKQQVRQAEGRKAQAAIPEIEIT